MDYSNISHTFRVTWKKPTKGTFAIVWKMLTVREMGFMWVTQRASTHNNPQRKLWSQFLQVQMLIWLEYISTASRQNVLTIDVQENRLKCKFISDLFSCTLVFVVYDVLSGMWWYYAFYHKLLCLYCSMNPDITKNVPLKTNQIFTKRFPILHSNISTGMCLVIANPTLWLVYDICMKLWWMPMHRYEFLFIESYKLRKCRKEKCNLDTYLS